MNVNLTPNITGKNVNIIKGATQADLTNSVNNSKTYRYEAEAFSIVSEAKSVEASYSALNASISSTNASDKATIATTKANEANNSAINASASEAVCIAKATITTDKANIATAQSVIATDKANEASVSANTATTQAGIATTKASEASTSASNALTSENNADTSEANALIYRNQAESFANSINPSDLVHISGTETITGNKTFSGTVSGLTKATVGLGNVDNTSDANKPVGTATQNALNTKVDTTTNQTIAGVKTFSSSPIVPTPTAGTQVANKEYVDTKVSKDGTGAIGTWGINITGNAETAKNVSDGRAVVRGTGNDYNLGGVEVLGNGVANTVFPTMGFHQGGLYASSLQLRGGGDFRFYAQGGVSYANVTANAFIGNLSGNSATATKLSTTNANWSTNGTINNAVGMLAWKNYGNDHVIFDASNGTSPAGTAINNTNAQIGWASSYPTLMGWNGASTYGVRVDTARLAETATALSGVVGSAPSYACRAWVNFNGTGVVAIRASGNVSSVADNGTGDYTIYFTTAMPDENYASAGMSWAPDNTIRAITSHNRLTTAMNIRTIASVNVQEDGNYFGVAIFR